MSNDGSQPTHEESEVPLSMVLPNLLLHDDFFDLTLEGTDGESVRANRNILAARSRVFRGMLYGKYAEATKSTVSLGYEGPILKAITEYCYTDDICAFRSECKGSMVRPMVCLSAASDYYGLLVLCERVKDWAYSQMAEDPCRACEFLQEADTHGAAAADISEYALKLIRKNPIGTLLSPAESDGKGVLVLSSPALEKILRDNAMNADELAMFRILKKWAELDESVQATGETSQNRIENARSLTKLIDLNHIKPSDLCGVVELSGLVSRDRLLETFKTQALLLEKIQFEIGRRRLPCWDCSKDAFIQGREGHCATTAMLQCAPMISGVHKWEIEVRTLGYPYDVDDEIGVCCIGKSCRRTAWLSAEQTAWVYVSNGETWHAGKKVGCHQPYGRGRIITFTLDLRTEGSLTASVDGQEPFQLFHHMLGGFKGGGEPSFVPGVSLRPGATVYFLGFVSS